MGPDTAQNAESIMRLLFMASLRVYRPPTLKPDAHLRHELTVGKLKTALLKRHGHQHLCLTRQQLLQKPNSHSV